MENGCLICGSDERRLLEHHTDYIKDITVPLCYSCHEKLHSGSLISDIPTPSKPERNKGIVTGNLKESYGVAQVKKGLIINVPIVLLEAINAHEGDYIQIKLNLIKEDE